MRNSIIKLRIKRVSLRNIPPNYHNLQQSRMIKLPNSLKLLKTKVPNFQNYHDQSQNTKISIHKPKINSKLSKIS